jgi:hypothetical protein
MNFFMENTKIMSEGLVTYDVSDSHVVRIANSLFPEIAAIWLTRNSSTATTSYNPIPISKPR